MATGGGESPWPLPLAPGDLSQGASRKKTRKVPTKQRTDRANVTRVTDESLARKLQEEEERRMLDADKMCAQNLQEQFDGLRLCNDHLTANEIHDKELQGTKTDDMAMAQELGDCELAYQLQMELDGKMANELSEKGTERIDSKNKNPFPLRLDNNSTSGWAGRSMVRNGTVPERREAMERGNDRIDGLATAVLNDQGTLFLPEEFVPFLLDSGDSNTSGGLHPALVNLTPHLSENQLAAIQVDPLNFLQQMTGAASQDMWMDNEDFTGDNYEALWDLADRIGEAQDRGMSSEDIETLPTCQYEACRASGGSRGQPRQEDITSDEESHTCKVCLSEFEAGEMLRTLPCCHRFHVPCIDKWIKRNAVCPVCRLEVKDNLRNREDGNS